MAALLFVCRYNACRSRIAEALARSLAPLSWTIESAGWTPSARYDAKAAELLERHGLALGRSEPKGLDALAPRRWDCVVDIGGGDLRGRIASWVYVDWDIPDPHDGPPHVYEELFAETERRVATLIRAIEQDAVAR